MSAHHKMLLRLRNVNDLVNERLGLKDKSELTEQNRSDWNWIVKGKMTGNKEFTHIYKLLIQKMKANNIFYLI
jgi:hypothetical protein